MENINVNIDKVLDFVSQDEINQLKDSAFDSLKALKNKSGKGNDFTGWVDLPSSIDEEQIKEIALTAAELRQRINTIVIIGIGGSYLGSKAVDEALSHSFEFIKGNQVAPMMIFAGHNIDEDYMHDLIDVLQYTNYGIVVISKSGTTTEPAITFRILKDHLEAMFGEEEAKKRIVAVTDGKKGALREMADNKGYKSFVIPDDVGGRYSVLTPVGLVPLAIGGYDIKSLIAGARDMQDLCANQNTSFEDNPAMQYAAARNALYKKGKKIEVMVNYTTRLHFLTEWWKQLFGESEGKDGKGIFPAGVDFTTDLHSMGQYIQEGERTLFETVVSLKSNQHKLLIPKDPENYDKLNYLAGKEVEQVNKMAELGTMLAHVDGGVPNIKIEIPKLTEYHLGQIMYFFEIACGISGYMLDVNPFDQPGVEAYKKNMFALLEKPGFEEETKKIKDKLK